jgi:hypothetical protein
MTDQIEVFVGNPPEKEKMVAQLFVKNGGQWGEIDQENGPLEIEIYGPDGRVLRFRVDELEHVIKLVKGRLVGE